MRVFSTAIKGELNKQFGSEPLVIAEIEFVQGSPIAYSDRKLNGEEYPLPRIIDVGNLDSSTLVALQSDSQSVSLTLDDTDGSLKTLIEANDINLSKVRFYLGFQGVAYSERALLMDGVIHSPVVYDDISKSLTLSVLSRVSDSEVGFSMDEGDFPNVPEDQRGLQWPLVFGDVCNIKTLRLKANLKGILGEPLGAIDPTIEARLCQAYNLICPITIKKEFQDEINTLIAERTAAVAALNAKLVADAKGILSYRYSAALGGAGGIMYDASTAEGLATICIRRKTPEENPRGRDFWYTFITDCVSPYQKEQNLVREYEDKIRAVAERGLAILQECNDARHSQICAIITERAQQAPYVKSSVEILGGESFPQNTPIVIRIRDVKYNGVMVGDTFTITGVTHPDSIAIENPPCIPITMGYQYQGKPSSVFLPGTVAGCLNNPEVVDVVIGPGASWKYFQDFEKGRFIWMPTGTEVFLESSSGLTNIVSLVPGVITQVCAYRTFGDLQFLTEVDTSEYEVGAVNYGDYQVSELTFTRPLSDIPDEKWEDDIFVSFESGTGPNPVNVIKYLVDTYTEYTYDTVSFDAVETLLTNYPANFVVRESKSAFQLIKEIAYQFRCAVTVRGGVVYLTYLSKEPTSLRTITTADILTGTFLNTTTPTEDLVTKHVVNWSIADARIFKTQTTEDSFTLKHNVSRYGVSGDTKDYFTQNTFTSIEKSATFWMIREANAWRYIEFETPIKHLDLDVYDCITVTFPGFPTTKCIIDSLNVDFSNNTIKFKCWTPMLAGTNVQYGFAWPATLAATALFPGPNYIDSGALGLRKTVTPPVGHPLRAGYTGIIPGIGTDGDRYPSDIGDTYPVNPCLAIQPTESEFTADLEPVFADIATKDFSDFADGLDRQSPAPTAFTQATGGGGDDTGGGGGSGGTSKRRGPLKKCTIEGNTGCNFTVTVTYQLPDLIREGCDSGPCISNSTSTGYACSATIDSACHVFADSSSAESFRASKQAEAESQVCQQRKGVWGIYSVSAVSQDKLTCESIFDPEASIFSPEDSVFRPKESIFQPEESPFTPEGSIFQPEESIYRPAGSVFNAGTAGSYTSNASLRSYLAEQSILHPETL